MSLVISPRVLDLYNFGGFNLLDTNGTSTDDDGCPTGWNVFDYGLGWVLVVGTIVSYLPQHIKICVERSHAGISFAFFILGTFLSFASLFNYIALDYRNTFNCCGDGVSFLDCSGAFLAFEQLALIFLCQHLLVILYIVYYDHEHEDRLEQKAREASGRGGIYEQIEYKRRKLWSAIMILAELIFTGIYIWFAQIYGVDSSESDTMYYYGMTQMGIASITACLQNLPQIWETHQHRSLGALSITTVVLQGVGSVLTAVNLAPHGSWEIWAPYVVVAVTYGVIMCQALYWYLQKRMGKSIDERLLENDETNGDGNSAAGEIN